MKVPFNEPYLRPISLSGSNCLRTLGKYYQACLNKINKDMGFERVILTPSCTAALELVALTLNIQPGDEVIIPSYTYVSTANAFALRGAKLIFVDTYNHHPTIDLKLIERSITPKTKAIIVVHYGGIAINYEGLKKLKKKHAIPIVEDAAHCFGAKADKANIGSVGDFAAFSFHETKNITCGQGGAVVVNNKKYWRLANMISQCGTDKVDFIEKKVKFYSWQVVGSNYLLAEPLCAILLANLTLRKAINERRMVLWNNYYEELSPLAKQKLIRLPPLDKGGNGHIFYLTVENKKYRDRLIKYLKKLGVEATFHYSPLHLSHYTLSKGSKQVLKNTEFFGERLLRLPIFYQLTDHQQNHVIKGVRNFYTISG